MKIYALSITVIVNRIRYGYGAGEHWTLDKRLTGNKL